jgi:hypothetical protein
VCSTTRLYGVPADNNIKQLNLSFASEIHRTVTDHFTFGLVCIAVRMCEAPVGAVGAVGAIGEV